ncbi:hypothetical protein [Streptomyces sp. NPDC014995]
MNALRREEMDEAFPVPLDAPTPTRVEVRRGVEAAQIIGRGCVSSS